MGHLILKFRPFDLKIFEFLDFSYILEGLRRRLKKISSLTLIEQTVDFFPIFWWIFDDFSRSDYLIPSNYKALTLRHASQRPESFFLSFFFEHWRHREWIFVTLGVRLSGTTSFFTGVSDREVGFDHLTIKARFYPRTGLKKKSKKIHSTIWLLVYLRGHSFTLRWCKRWSLYFTHKKFGWKRSLWKCPMICCPALPSKFF